VNVFMNKFRKLGFIEYNGDIVVHHALLSVVLHDTLIAEPSEPSEPEGSAASPRRSWGTRNA
jgi:hypothetical protein